MINDLYTRVIGLSPDVISANFGPYSTVAIASVCLEDSVSVLAQACYAVEEALAHRLWYREKARPPDEMAAVFYSRFYIDDAALRLYAAGEHLAAAIIAMLEIDSAQLESYRGKKVSQQAAVAKFLSDERLDHPLTAAVQKLNSKEWRKTIDYRNKWVHDQPPLVKGQGIVYSRRQRWETSDSGKSYKLGFGGGDKAEYSMEDLLAFVQPALHQFAEACNSVVENYLRLLDRPQIAGPLSTPGASA
jgi:hypothetical protein